MSIGLGVTKVVTERNVNLNQAENTVLLRYTASKPAVLQRIGVIGDSGDGLLDAMVLKTRIEDTADGSVADADGAGTLTPDGAKSRGVGVYKDAEERVVVNAGDEILVAIDTSAGDTSTGHVSLEIVELPFAGAEIDRWEASA